MADGGEWERVCKDQERLGCGRGWGVGEGGEWETVGTVSAARVSGLCTSLCLPGVLTHYIGTIL